MKDIRIVCHHDLYLFDCARLGQAIEDDVYYVEKSRACVNCLRIKKNYLVIYFEVSA